MSRFFVKQLYSSNASLLKAKIIIRLYKYVPHLSVACSVRRLTTPHIRVQRSYRTVTHRRRIPVVTANMVRSPSPRQRREGTSIKEAVRFRRVSINIPHTCFERAAILQRLPTVSTSQSDRTQAKAPSSKKHTHFIRKSYTMNPQSTDARVVSRGSCEDRSSEAACTHQLLGRHACTQCHDVMTVSTSHSNPRRALDGGRRRHLSVHRLRNSDYNECERQVVDGERGGGDHQRIERRERQETREKVEKVFQLFGFDYSLVGVGRSRRYCNTGPTRGEVGASSCIFSQFQKSV